MSLTRTQRDAMERAQQGNWELADAIEVVARSEEVWPLRYDWPLIGGIRQGGRLQFLAYGNSGCTDECDEHCDGGDACNGVEQEEVMLVTDLNDIVRWRSNPAENDGYPPPPFEWVDLPLHKAHATVAAYHAAVTQPTQQTLIPEPA